MQSFNYVWSYSIQFLQLHWHQKAFSNSSAWKKVLEIYFINGPLFLFYILKKFYKKQKDNTHCSQFNALWDKFLSIDINRNLFIIFFSGIPLTPKTEITLKNRFLRKQNFYIFWHIFAKTFICYMLIETLILK